MLSDILSGNVVLSVLGQVAYKYVEDLATVWCEWCEMELRHKNFKSALELMRRATYTPDKINRREVRLRIILSLTMHYSLVDQSDEHSARGAVTCAQVRGGLSS